MMLPCKTLAGLSLALLLSACGPAVHEQARPVEPEKAVAPVAVSVPAVGPAVTVEFSIMAEVLHMAEGISIWRRDMPRTLFRAFDDRFGLDEADRQLVKRFAFIRNELWERELKAQPAVSFAQPFGPAGLFPQLAPGPQARLWLAALAAPEPAALARGLTGVVEPADAEAVAGLLGQIAPRVGQLVAELDAFRQPCAELSRLLASGRLPQLIEGLGRLVGVDARKLRFAIHPVWVPAGQPSRAWAVGDVIVLELPAGQAVGPAQVAEVVRALTSRLLARLDPKTQVLATNRFVELAGYRDRPLALIQSIEDAAGYGLAAPLVAAGPAQVPAWPGDDARKRSAEAMTGLLREWLASGKKLDGVFALKAAKLQVQAVPARPSDYVDGSMVIAHDAVLKPFKEKVTRWAVWKFPIDQQFNYPRKLDYSPGRSVLMILTPKDLKMLPARFPGKPEIVAAFENAFDLLNKKKGVIISLPRESRGYVFLMAANGPEAMQRVAKAFFELESIPSQVVTVD